MLAGCWRLLGCDCVVTSHGPGLLAWLRRLAPAIRFVDVWHGIGFKGFDDQFFKHTLHRYDRIFVGSDHQKVAYREQWGFSDSQLRVTGYARVDSFVHAAETGRRVRRELGVGEDQAVIIYAPTYRGASEPGEIPFGVSVEQFLFALDDLARARNGRVILRLHMNSRQRLDVSLHDTLSSLGQAEFPETNDLLCAADVVITDWSSIAADFYALGRPVVFLDVPPPATHTRLTDLERAGDVACCLPELRSLVEVALDNPGAARARQEQARRKCFGDTLDGASATRYDRELRALLGLTGG